MCAKAYQISIPPTYKIFAEAWLIMWYNAKFWVISYPIIWSIDICINMKNKRRRFNKWTRLIHAYTSASTLIHTYFSIHANPYLYFSIHANLYLYFSIHANPYLYFSIHANLYLYFSIHANPYFYFSIHANLRANNRLFYRNCYCSTQTIDFWNFLAFKVEVLFRRNVAAVTCSVQWKCWT